MLGWMYSQVLFFFFWSIPQVLHFPVIPYQIPNLIKVWNLLYVLEGLYRSLLAYATSVSVYLPN